LQTERRRDKISIKERNKQLIQFVRNVPFLPPIDALKIKVDKLIPSAKVQKCETFHLFVAGKDQNGNSTEMTYTWENSDNRIKFVIVFVILMLKLTSWMQDEFVKRDINYRIIAIDQSKLHSDNYGCNATGSRAKR